MVASAFLAQLLADLLQIWHNHRASLLLSAASLVAVVQFTIYIRRRRETLPIVVGATLEKVIQKPLSQEKRIVELRPEWLPENTVFLDGASPKEKNPPRAPKAKRIPKKVRGQKAPSKAERFGPAPYDHTAACIRPIIFWQSLNGSTERYATEFASQFGIWVSGNADRKPEGEILEAEVIDISYMEHDEYFVSLPKEEMPNTYYFYIILVPSYNIDTILQNFIDNLQETYNDFRIDTAPLSPLLGYSVFGFGDKEGWPTEVDGFCSHAREVDKWMARLTGRKRAYPVGMGDVKSDVNIQLKQWRNGVQEALSEIGNGRGLGDGIPGSGAAVESDDEDLSSAEDSDPETSTRRSIKPKKSTARVDDVEDLGGMATEPFDDPIEIDFTTYKSKATAALTAPVLKEMVPQSSPTYASLTKQGYAIVGSHSGVKICRWTKSAMRGRGSCYKYSFYGIASHLCMEATPSLSCASKCVFCWRHSTNPVGTTWRWITDSPDVIFEGITTAHYKKIKMMKGVPGVRADRFAEAMRIRHCALSLVGEPIFYPHINELLTIMHRSRISTFLVCNAQHPAQLASLIPVTQLYVSIDASNKESLRKIDRPLHRDFWERFCACLDILRNRRFEQRTVFRLTLVKDFNMAEEVKGYADLIERALPGLVEVKGVTYCGTSAAGTAGLTMQNVPFYEEVSSFVLELSKELVSRDLPYGIAAEHAHSCCVLLADETRFKRDGRWATRIDYERFFDLFEGKAQGSLKEIGEDGEEKVVGWRPEDYVGGETPEWALWGNGGFDPRDVRFYRKGKGPKVEKEEDKEYNLSGNREGEEKVKAKAKVEVAALEF